MVVGGDNALGQCKVEGWRNIIQVAAGGWHTVGSKDHNTVVAVGRSLEGQCDVGSWTDITQVATGGSHTVGLNSDGTVVAVGDNDLGQCNVGGWTDIIQVAAGALHTMGLKSDGTVVAVGGEAELPEWNLYETPARRYSLTILSTPGGSVTEPEEGAHTYDEGIVQNLVAEPEEGYRFACWTGDVGTIADVYAAQTTITMEGYYSITANFELEEGLCSLTISSTAGGAVTVPGEGTFTYDEGTVVDLVAQHDEGHRFVNWTGDPIDGVEDAETTIIMQGDYSITANFETVSRCFIATAAYGTPMAEEIQILREFRDKYLLTNPVGQALADLYYGVSPPIAEFITEHPSLKPIVRTGLVPAVTMGTVAVNTTPAEKAAIAALLVLISVALAIWAIRRRSKLPECA